MVGNEVYNGLFLFACFILLRCNALINSNYFDSRLKLTNGALFGPACLAIFYGVCRDAI